MTPEDIHRRWAPDDGPWSPWVKPVLFAALRLHDGMEAPARVVELPRSFASLERDVLGPLLEARVSTPEHPYREKAVARDTAVVVDLPGERGAEVGVAFAISRIS
ncbi:hypothetical protein AKJ09_05946 [Labilithrix luteola]|uniref:Uncharacterized protein n=1 Tax=Labilithrix luteola TaxID=1391654 RepID=A0A0K1Q0M5_9BACT|nr:hypothetical protein [Labilithrix luteola]AKU99282.1 hypothetical protein AKJ09_05946 [Labilithrix luteola]